jgi:ligand-binding sensor domain-containing protein
VQTTKRAVSYSLLLTIPALISCAGLRAQQLPIKTYTTSDGLPRNGINHIVRDSHGFLWFCTIEGLSRFDGYTFTNYGVEQGIPALSAAPPIMARNTCAAGVAGGVT